MKITDICTQKNNPLKVSVFVDDKYAFSLDKDDPLSLKIKKDMEISDTQFYNFKMESDFSKAEKYAFDILSKKPYSKKELSDKLFKRGYEEILIYELTDKLSDLGYLDDMEYTKLFITYAKEKLWGNIKIKYELSKKGIDEGLIRQCLLEDSTDDTQDAIMSLIKTKYKGEDFSNMKTKAKNNKIYFAKGF